MKAALHVITRKNNSTLLLDKTISYELGEQSIIRPMMASSMMT